MNCPNKIIAAIPKLINLNPIVVSAPPSPELVARVRELYQSRVSDVRFLIPVLNGLPKQEIIAALPKLIKLNPIVSAPSSAELVARVRELYESRVSDVRFLIPVLNGLPKKEIIAALPKLIKLNPIVVSVPPSAKLVARVRELYQSRVSDVKFLIPVLNGLPKQEIIAALPKLIKLNPIVFLAPPSAELVARVRELYLGLCEYSNVRVIRVEYFTTRNYSY